MISSARLGDKHVCPMPGHGTTPIASASADTNINFMGAARVGDTCGCGAVIITGFPSIVVNGRPMAHLGSPTSHGGTIITGSGDVGGGFVFGGATGAAIINFAKLGAIRPNGTVDDERMATLLADPTLMAKATVANAVIDPSSPDSQSADADKHDETKPKVCNHPDLMEALASYITDEMNRNISDPSVLKMKKLLSYDTAAETKERMETPWYAQVGFGNNAQTTGYANTVAALGLWTSKVGQGMDWDHKTKIRHQFGDVWQKEGKYDYYYDIWSNIHYGYVGMAGGLSESVLLDGAGAEQIVSDSIRKVQKWDERDGPHMTEGVDGLRSFDDIPDRVSISIGIDLYQRYPNGGITAKIIKDEVLAVDPSRWGKGIRVHECK